MYPDSTVTRMRAEFAKPFREFELDSAIHGFAALRVLRPIMVSLRSDKFYTEEREENLQVPKIDHAPGAGYNRITKKFKEVSYSTREVGIEYPLVDPVLNSFATLADAEGDAVRCLWEAIHRGIEKKLVDNVLLNASVVTQGAAAAASWKSNHSTATPIADVLNGVKKIWETTRQRANVVVMSFDDVLDMVQTDEIRNLIKFSGHVDPLMAFKALPRIAEAMLVEEIIVAGAPLNTAGKGATATLTGIWTPGSVGIYKRASSNAGINEACIGRVPTWNGMGDSIGTGEDPSFAVESYREEQTKSTIFRSTAHADLTSEATKLMPKAGYIISGTQA